MSLSPRPGLALSIDYTPSVLGDALSKTAVTHGRNENLDDELIARGASDLRRLKKVKKEVIQSNYHTQTIGLHWQTYFIKGMGG